MAKAGEVYMSIAGVCLGRYAHIIGQTYYDLLERGDYGELETWIGIKGILEAVCEGVEMQSRKYQRPIIKDELLKAILYDDAEHFPKFNHRDLNKYEYADFVVRVMAMVHDQLVTDSVSLSRVQNRHRQNELFRYMPMALIGFKEARKETEIYVDPVLRGIGFEIDKTLIEEGYKSYSKKFLREHVIVEAGDLVDRLSNRKFYPILPADVHRKIRCKATANKIAKQCFDKMGMPTEVDFVGID